MIKHVLISLIFNTICFISFSQKLGEINRDIEVNNKIFKTQYEYQLDKKDTILDGKYKISHEFLDDSTHLKVISIDGHFNKNIPNDTWILRNGLFEKTNIGNFNEYKYALNLDGEEFIIKGRFDNGQKNGKWEYNNWNIVSSEISDTNLQVVINYNNNTIQDDFYFSNDSEHIECKVNSSGHTSGKWSYYTKLANGERELSKELIFEDNVLTEKIIFDNNKNYHFKFLENDNLHHIVEVMEVDEHFFEIIKLKSLVSDPENYYKLVKKEASNNLIFYTIREIEILDSIFSKITDNSITPSIRTKVWKLPYSSIEKEHFNTLAGQISIIDSIIFNIQNDPQINLTKLSNKEIDKYTQILNNLDTKLINKLDSIMSYYKKGSLEYVNRDVMISNFLKEDHTVSLEFEENETLYQFTPFVNNDSSEEASQNLLFFLEGVSTEVNHIMDSLDIHIYEIKKERKLVKQETKVLSKYEYLKRLNDSLKNPYLNNIAGFEVNQFIENFIESELIAYTKLDSISTKMGAIEPLFNCFEQTERLIIDLQKTAEKTQFIKDLYVQTVFNPHISDYMKDTKKSNIYNAYKDILLIKVYENLKYLNCGNIIESRENLELLFSGMERIINENTRKIERKIKKTKDPKEMSEILNFNLNFYE